MQDPEELAARVRALSEAVERLGDPAARAAAEDLAAALMALYGEGLERILAALDAAGDEGVALRERLEADGVVASLLLMHGLYRVPLEERVQEGLDAVRPYMESHGGNVELLGVKDGVARLRLEGHCHGCAASAQTLEQAIETALAGTAPDLLGLEVDGLTELGEGHAPPAGVELPLVSISTPAPAVESGRCELCPMTVGEGHRHLLHLGERRILCVCETCWSLRSGEADYVPTGNRTLWLDRLRLEEDVWASFGIPIGLAFFLRSSESGGVVALYPSPAGATESEVDAGAWARFVSENPDLAELQPDAEALVVNRLAEPPQYAIAPIDRCYALVGLVKTRWEGISGGPELAGAIAGFFDELRAEGTAARRAVVS